MPLFANIILVTIFFISAFFIWFVLLGGSTWLCAVAVGIARGIVRGASDDEIARGWADAFREAVEEGLRDRARRSSK